MKISLYLNLLLLALVMKIVTANVRLQRSPQRSPQQYCGSKLADIMKVLCKSNYNSPNLQKKSQIDVLDYKDLEDYNAIDYPYIPKKRAMSFMPLRLLRSSKRSIIDECCNRPCYLSELKTYCGSQ